VEGELGGDFTTAKTFRIAPTSWSSPSMHVSNGRAAASGHTFKLLCHSRSGAILLLDSWLPSLCPSHALYSFILSASALAPCCQRSACCPAAAPAFARSVGRPTPLRGGGPLREQVSHLRAGFSPSGSSPFPSGVRTADVRHSSSLP
jgi:hypothetical protein